MPLTANREVPFYASADLIDVPMDDNVLIFKGALVGRNRATGFARALTVGDEFLGLAYKKADNTQSGHVAGGVNVRLHQAIDIVHALPSVATGDIGKDAYALDDSTLTLVGLSASRIGRVVGVEGTGVARVRIQPAASLSGVMENSPVVQMADADATLTLDHMNRTLLIANTAARTLNLPAAATARAGAWFRVVKTSAAAFAVTLDPSGAELIDGGATFAGVDAVNDTVLALCTGSAWIILSRDIS